MHGLPAGAGNASRSIKLKLADGAAVGQADGILRAYTIVSDASVDTYLLAAGLSDGYGEQLELSVVKLLMLEADPANSDVLRLGGGSFGGPLGDPEPTVGVSPGDTLLWLAESASGWAVDPDADALPIAGTAGDLYKLTVVGLSSAVSAPAWALQPAIVAPVGVGRQVSCSAGDISGSPEIGYEGRTNGKRSSTPTRRPSRPSPLDAGKKLTRTTFATDGAGNVSVTTPPALVGSVAPLIDGCTDAA